MVIGRQPDRVPVYAPARPSLVLASFLGAILGAAFIAFLSTGGIKADGMTYADLAAILLSAVGVIVAIFGGVLAIAAFWGFEQMKLEAVRSATNASLAETREQIENGSIRRYILEEVETRISEIVASPDFDRRVRARVDQIVLGKPDDRLLDDDDDGDDR
ncbi:hypothetical protein C8J46_10612 [Sphingomonas sp. PP-F2F-A104-K0414]|nr:hypothetical protein C8J46_10612 [Sphingomonas sp. PP-F2F-A104-K0414]